MMRLRAAFQTIAITLANGYILFFYSERLFWAMPRPDDTLVDLALALFAYSLAGYLILALVGWLQIRTWYGLLILGAVFGWLIEGVWAYTLYGLDPPSPFPLSVLVTAVNWHSLITVIFGWWLIPLLLRRQRTLWTVVVSLGLGLFWGAWAIFERFESPPIIPSVTEFALHAFISSLLLIGSYWLLAQLAVWTFAPTRAGLMIVAALHIAWFVLINVMSLGLGGFAVLLLTLLLLGSCSALWAARSNAGGMTVLEAYLGEVTPIRYGLLLLAPLTATVFYALTLPGGSAVPPLHQIIFIANVVAAVGVSGAALYFTFRDIVRKHRSIV